jgi:hypothetical protein
MVGAGVERVARHVALARRIVIELSATSTDGSVCVSFDSDSGNLLSLVSGGFPFSIDSGPTASIAGGIHLIPTVTQPSPATVVIATTICLPCVDVPCSINPTTLTQTISPSG